MVISRIRSAALRMLALAPILLLTACPERDYVSIRPGSTRSHLVFQVSSVRDDPQSGYDGGIRIDHCGNPPDYTSIPVWGASPALDLIAPPVHEIVFGQLPTGYEPLMNQPAAPMELVPGCYLVTLSGTGRTTFDVHSDGTVVERPPERH